MRYKPKADWSRLNMLFLIVFAILSGVGMIITFIGLGLFSMDYSESVFNETTIVGLSLVAPLGLLLALNLIWYSFLGIQLLILEIGDCFYWKEEDDNDE